MCFLLILLKKTLKKRTEKSLKLGSVRRPPRPFENFYHEGLVSKGNIIYIANVSPPNSKLQFFFAQQSGNTLELITTDSK